MFTKAIVRRPAKSLVQGITSNPQLGKPDYDKALRQHDAYIAALEKCGVAVKVLPALEAYPDSCFMEDVALCTRKFALVTNPGAPSRRGEIEGIAEVLAGYFADIDRIRAPGTLEGGDVMMVGDRFYVGLSARTNAEGARQLVAALEKRGLSGQGVDMREMLHLKTGLSYLEEGFLLVAGEFLAAPEFASFKRIEVAPEESYAANCIRVNEHVLVPSGFPKTEARIREAGLSVILVDTSEYRKLDGGLSCLSLRF
ncbi:MAG TPA: arginine deiminase family protein [Spirochaetales bacterium]|nr:arginine deiminase family protein [Spirochaetales bacterium]HRY53475.1 arginine deiminase family protein [Spirochaetia bacterium]